ncbi:MAG: YceI family protein [Tannerella sp.]|jgi:polyisoprenoid-binding protein YceI|nr:YceI family protein [Tannerella sp.]
MKKMNLRSFLTLLAAMLFLSTGGQLTAQTLKFNAAKSKFLIKGDSNLHPWETDVNEVPGEATIDAEAKALKSLTISIPVNSIHSKEGGDMMDTKTYETFNYKKNPDIVFTLTEVKSLTINSDKSISATVAGNLSMGGSTKPVTVSAVGKSDGAGSYVFTGSLPLKLTTFGMKPPTMFLGTLKVKDEISVEYTITVDGINSSAL